MFSTWHNIVVVRVAKLHFLLRFNTGLIYHGNSVSFQFFELLPPNPGTMILLSLVFLWSENKGIPQQKCQVNRSYQAHRMPVRWINVLTLGGKFLTWTLLTGSDRMDLLPNRHCISIQDLHVGLRVRHLQCCFFFFQGHDWNSGTGLFSHPLECVLPRGERDFFMMSAIGLLFVVFMP